ncbi:PAS domain-containing sensor histidine kinase [Chitinophaga rhizophila]|uniref:histidine kinase n=1 Tax=Chitinophaga rhizophila TaxID=2866212 RepID=A0ABS7GBJ3_9BACT|nr:ATP-binding protein [Chitinophaga rhizophila]MBW8685045.1 GAF domain-containing protein [Chitinophaga rhizophila]
MEVQQLLDTNEARLKAVIEATPECIKIVGPDGLVQFMNKAGLCMVEATEGQSVEGACVFDLIAPDHRATWIENHNRVCQGESINWEFDIIGLRGSRRHMETHAVPLRNSDGTYSQLAVTHDITAKKVAERALKRNEIILKGQKYALEQAVHGYPLREVLETIVRTVEEQSERQLFASILLMAKDGKHLLLGASPSLPQTYNDAVDGGEIGPLAGSCGTAAFTGEEILVEDIANNPLWANYKDLALSHGLRACWSTPILSSQRTPLATFSLYYPTEQMPAAEDRQAVELMARTAGIVIEWYKDVAERKALMAQLETRVSERTDELNNVNAALQSSNDTLEQFAHVASHDLKEPVRKIKIFTSRLQDEAGEQLNDKGKTYLHKILSSAERMSTMIEGVLNYSVQNGSQQINEKVDLNTTITEIRNDLEVLIQQKQADITVDPLPVIEGDRILIHQLFYNLLNNSLKFTRDGVPPKIVIRAVPVLPDDVASYDIIVTDNGIGFDQEQSEKIFETFTRLNSKDKYDGTGLGLSLCRKIVQRHHGTITATSEYGEGATFSITLPVLQPAPDVAQEHKLNA